MRQRLLASLFCLIALTLLPVGCGGERPVAETTWQGRVKMLLWLNRTVLAPGQVLEVRVQVENISREDMEFTMWNIGDRPIYNRIVRPYGEVLPLRSPEDATVVLPAVNFGVLPPRIAVVRKVNWQVTEQVPNGKYTLEAVFYPGRQIDSKRESLVLSRSIEVTGSFTIISPEEARQKALAQPSVQLWMRAHSGPAVGREMKGKYLVNMGGQWQPASREVYLEALATGQTPKATLLESQPRKWKLVFASKFGFPPFEIALLLNAETGEPFSVDPDLVAEMNGGVVATFQAGSSEFRVFTTNPKTIEQLLALQQGTSAAAIPHGQLVSGPGAGLHNAPWSWHLDPVETRMAEVTIELCDGTPDFIEEDLEYWLQTVKSFCPWNAKLAKIEDYR